jgi:hypothetical protein
MLCSMWSSISFLAHGASFFAIASMIRECSSARQLVAVGASYRKDHRAGERGQLGHAARARRAAGELSRQGVELAGQADHRALVVAADTVDLGEALLAQLRPRMEAMLEDGISAARIAMYFVRSTRSVRPGEVMLWIETLSSVSGMEFSINGDLWAAKPHRNPRTQQLDEERETLPRSPSAW